jgi:hypothetical protein
MRAPSHLDFLRSAGLARGYVKQNVYRLDAVMGRWEDGICASNSGVVDRFRCRNASSVLRHFEVVSLPL